MEEAPPFIELFRWMDNNLPGTFWLRESTYGFTSLLTLHVVGICIFLGLIFMMDLRLVGVANRATRAATIQAKLFPWQMVGFAVIVLSGVGLFYAQPMTYYNKVWFWVKMGLIVLAGVNAGVIHLLTRTPEGWDSGLARMAGAFSLLLWTGVLFSGRLVAYEWWTNFYF